MEYSAICRAAQSQWTSRQLRTYCGVREGGIYPWYQAEASRVEQRQLKAFWHKSQ